MHNPKNVYDQESDNSDNRPAGEPETQPAQEEPLSSQLENDVPRETLAVIHKQDASSQHDLLPGPPAERIAETTSSLLLTSDSEEDGSTPFVQGNEGATIPVVLSSQYPANPPVVDMRKQPSPPDEPQLEVGEWIKPGQFTTGTATEGIYRGRQIIGSPGSVLKVPTRPPQITGLDYRADLMADAHVLGSLHVSAASLRGASHFESAEPRQDSYALGSTRSEEWLILAMADGVSSGRFSHLAADTACLHGVSSAKELLNSLEGQQTSVEQVVALQWSKVLEEVRTAILNQARRIIGSAVKNLDGNRANPEDVPPETYARAMSTTFELTVISCAPVEGRHIFARVLFAGDGSALIVDRDLGWQVIGVGKADSNHIASNAVVPLPIHPGPPLTVGGFLTPGQALVITTDGIGDFLADGSTSLGGYLHDRWSKTLGLTDFIDSVSFLTEQADDDRTALVVWV